MNAVNVAATLMFLTWQGVADWRQIVVADEFKVSPLDSQRQRARCRPARYGAQPYAVANHCRVVCGCAYNSLSCR